MRSAGLSGFTPVKYVLRNPSLNNWEVSVAVEMRFSWSRTFGATGAGFISFSSID